MLNKNKVYTLYTVFFSITTMKTVDLLKDLAYWRHCYRINPSFLRLSHMNLTEKVSFMIKIHFIYNQKT